jgi:predicted nucleic-acid-binding protein
MAAIRGSLDTNVLLRWLTSDIPEQAREADRLLMGGGSFRVSDLAILELVFALERSYDYPREDIALNIGLLSDQKQLVFNRVLVDHAMSMYVARPKLSYADCALAAEAVLTSAAPLYTFDWKLTKQSEGTAKLV